jgi:glycosyltransferase involved in cell wall biosynthesis
MIKVAIIQKEIPHYRTRFFEVLTKVARAENFTITLFSGERPHGLPSPELAYKILPTHFIGKTGTGPCWLEGLQQAVSGSDVIVAPQELQCLNVLPMWFKRHSLCATWIWWGHGYNHQVSVSAGWARRAKETIKQYMTRRADGLITYTPGGAAFWKQKGLPQDWAIAYLNTLDVEGIRDIAKNISVQSLDEVRDKLGLNGKFVLLFSGRLYPEKEVDFLLRAFELIQEKQPNTALLIMGEGNERQGLETLVRELGLCHVFFLGNVTDPVLSSLYFKLADILAIPGLVGLAIVHGFALSLPLVTTQRDFHSPEIEYLTPETGIMTPHDERQYAERILALVEERELLAAMRDASFQRGNDLTLAQSTRRFVLAVKRFSHH